jgi:hypothetical protein
MSKPCSTHAAPLIGVLVVLIVILFITLARSNHMLTMALANDNTIREYVTL